MDMPQPTEHHRKLEKLAGTWRGEEKLHPSPWDPQGGMAEGRVVNRIALDGFILVQDWEQARGGMITFRGFGVLTYDVGERCYVMHWWDSMGMAPNVFRGNFEGDVLSLACETPMGRNRAVWDFDKPGSYTFRLEMSQDGQQWATFMEGGYVREG